MADEWKYKDLPRAANGIAPAKWNPDTGEFEVYTGVNDVKAIGVEDRLTAIENKLDSVIQNGSVNTQVTGSNVEELIDVNKNNQRKYLTNKVIQGGATERFVYRVRNERLSAFLRTSEATDWALYYRADPVEAGYIIDGFKEITTRESSSIGSGDIDLPRYVFIEFEVRNLTDIPMTVRSILIADMKGGRMDGL